MHNLRFLQKMTPFMITAVLFGASASMTGCAGTHKQDSTGEYIDDSVTTTKVKSAIFEDADLKSTEISVETHKGVVQLSGFVSSEAAIQKAGSIARQVKGVEAVKNDLRLK